ncbi:MAG: GNAT family N-acetyltransferase [Deinococcota bacterium]|nr:GNAT family N-acetyltransferase [Deinococcota bacterium]
MKSFLVRAARPADHGALAGVLAELLGRPQLAEGLKAALNTNLLRMLSAPGTALLVAEDEEAALLGFVSLWTRWGLLDAAPSGFIDRIVVRQAWQDSAVPHALLEQALGACQALGCGEVDFVPAEGSLLPSASLQAFGFEAAQEGRYRLSIL